jgi:hypothetical protein
MDDLKLGDKVEVQFTRTVDNVTHPPSWEDGTIDGLHWTSVHIKLADGNVMALPAHMRGRAWRRKRASNGVPL